MTIFRGLVAVLAGYLVFALRAVLLFQLSGADPHAHQNGPFTVFAVLYGMTFAAIGGMLTARLAPSRPPVHRVLLSVLIALGATVSLIASPGAGATWSQWGALLLMAPCASLAPGIMGSRPGAG